MRKFLMTSFLPLHCVATSRPRRISSSTYHYFLKVAVDIGSDKKVPILLTTIGLAIGIKELPYW